MTKTGVIESAGTAIRYAIDGSGPPLLLIAGTGYPGSTWSCEFIEPLSDRFSVIRFDHRGTGASPGTDDPYSTRLFAADAAAVLATVADGNAVVLGHSMGGRVAQWLAFDHAELVRGLVLAASGPGGPVADHSGGGIPIRTILRLVEVGYEAFIRELQRRTFFTAEYAAENPEAVQWLGDAFWADRPDLENYLKHVLARQGHDAREVLGDIAVATLVIVGDRDTHKGDTGSHFDQSRYLAEQIPNATLAVVPNVTHGLFWQDVDSTLGILMRWLNTMYP